MVGISTFCMPRIRKARYGKSKEGHGRCPLIIMLIFFRVVRSVVLQQLNGRNAWRKGGGEVFTICYICMDYLFG